MDIPNELPKSIKTKWLVRKTLSFYQMEDKWSKLDLYDCCQLFLFLGIIKHFVINFDTVVAIIRKVLDNIKLSHY